MILKMAQLPCGSCSYPRVSGGDPVYAERYTAEDELSPRERG